MQVERILERERIELGPQPGPQTQFLASEADIAVYGGSAGGGKTYALLLDPLRHHSNKDFGAVIFRRTSVQVRNEGGLWDESVKMYPLLGGKPREFCLEWRFQSGMAMGFSNLEYDNSVLNYQGAQIPWIGFDELTHFTEKQFFYMLSRNRSTSGVKPRIRATTNPDPDSWVKKLISWWLDENGEYPVPERSGVLRWFIRLNDSIIWAGNKEEIHERYGNGSEIQPKSITFIAAKLEDNKILMQKNPEYLGNLLAMNRVDRMRLRYGNWKVRAQAGMLFQREWLPMIDHIPDGWIRAVRFWDRAATEPNEQNPDPDWTRGLKMYRYMDGTFVVADLRSLRKRPHEVEQFIIGTAAHDSPGVRIVSQQDPGSAGVSEAEHFVRMLIGYDVHTKTISANKAVRAKPVSAQAEAHNIKVVRAHWNDDFFTELENFSEDEDDYNHDDIVDVLSGAFNELADGGLSILDC